jgi:hypothetical protein
MKVQQSLLETAVPSGPLLPPKKGGNPPTSRQAQISLLIPLLRTQLLARYTSFIQLKPLTGEQGVGGSSCLLIPPRIGRHHSLSA